MLLTMKPPIYAVASVFNQKNGVPEGTPFPYAFLEVLASNTNIAFQIVQVNIQRCQLLHSSEVNYLSDGSFVNILYFIILLSPN